MVDVGFYLLGHNRTLNKVDNLGISDKQNCYIFKDRGGTEYLIPIESVEYIIPHEDETEVVSSKAIFGTMDGFEELTNAEVFKKVFGFRVNEVDIQDMCELMDCRNMDCKDCCIHGHSNWNDRWENPNE